jgi:DNA-binding NarL/FixJ family response regulator
MGTAAGAKLVLLVDDHPRIRQYVRGILQEHSDLQVIGEASNGVESVHYARTLQPDVVIMDISMPYVDGVQATRLIKEEHTTMIIIGLSVFENAMTRDALMKQERAAF